MRFLLLLLFLGGCSVAPPISTSPDTLFDLSGRIAVKYANEGFFGNLRWIHRKSADEVWLLSPLGQTVAHILKNADGAVLTTSDRKAYRAEDVESLTEKILGWRLPLQGLDSWIRGKASAGSLSESSFEGKTLTRLNQDGWEIRYGQHFGNGMPREIELQRPGIRIKFIIDADT